LFTILKVSRAIVLIRLICKDKLRKEIDNGKKELKKKKAEKEKGDDKVNQSVIVSKNKSDKSKDSSLINIKDLRKN
jgi:hypothetical protein